jgi:hypothetical protein
LELDYELSMANIDDEIINALTPEILAKIVHYGIKDFDTEVAIGTRRIVDIFIQTSQGHQLVIEVENDRKFDVGETLRKLKKNMIYPIIVIIPIHFRRFAWRFQKAKMYVWYWTAKCKWVCRRCNKATLSESSITPNKCSNPSCKTGSNTLQWDIPEKIDFEEAENNPIESYEDFMRLFSESSHRFAVHI